MFVDEDCVDSRSGVDNLITRDCPWRERGQVRYEGCCSLSNGFVTEDGNLVVDSATQRWPTQIQIQYRH